MIAWASSDSTATGTITSLYSETRLASQVSAGTESWSAEVTTWGADSLTMTSRTGGSGGDDVDILCLGGADLSLLLGTLTTATSTGSADVTTTGIDPDAVLLCLGNTSSTTIASDGTASGISVGASDGTTHGGYASVDEDGADTTNAESAYSSSNAVYSRTSSGGTASDLVVGSVSMGAEKFSVNYTTVSGTARKGWFLAFGPASGASSWTVTLTDTASATDTYAHSVDTLRALTDTASATDLLTAAVDAVVALLDAASASDVLNAAAVVQAVISDLASASDTSTAAVDATVALTDAASATDTATGSFEAAGTVTLSDLASATDALTCAATLLVTLTDSASGTDAYTAAAELVRTLTDAAAATDSFTASMPGTWDVTLTELAAAVDVIAAVIAGADPAVSARYTITARARRLVIEARARRLEAVK